MEWLDIAVGTIQGNDHYLVRKNNQDAHHVIRDPHYCIAVVADGSGDTEKAPFSDAGSKIGGRLVARSLEVHYRKYRFQTPWIHSFEGITFLLEEVRQDVLRQIHNLTALLDEKPSKAVREFFQFTTVGALITPRVSAFFTIGDGFIFINGEMTRVGPFPENKPPYLALSLVSNDLENQDWLTFSIVGYEMTHNVQHFLLASDGLEDFIEHEETLTPNLKTPLGPVSQFWENEGFFTNFDNVRRRLHEANTTVQKVDWDKQVLRKHKALLTDDTTIIVGRIRRT